MRTSFEILKDIKGNNKKYLSCDEIAIKCILVAIEDTLIECAGLAHPHWKPETIRKRIMSLVNKVS